MSPIVTPSVLLQSLHAEADRNWPQTAGAAQGGEERPFWVQASHLCMLALRSPGVLPALRGVFMGRRHNGENRRLIASRHSQEWNVRINVVSSIGAN